MSNRSSPSIVRFERSFSLPGLDGVNPAGDYDVDVDEELVDGLSFVAWRRVATWLHLPARSVRAMARSRVMIDPSDLDAALKIDQSGS